ncbi:hypothetical protein HN51_034739 [Arachis hypogaea]
MRKKHKPSTSNTTAMKRMMRNPYEYHHDLDLKSIKRRCDELDVRHMRRPAIDFDPNFLRNILPKAV